MSDYHVCIQTNINHTQAVLSRIITSIINSLLTEIWLKCNNICWYLKRKSSWLDTMLDYYMMGQMALILEKLWKIHLQGSNQIKIILSTHLMISTIKVYDRYHKIVLAQNIQETCLEGILLVFAGQIKVDQWFWDQFFNTLIQTDQWKHNNVDPPLIWNLLKNFHFTFSITVGENISFRIPKCL